MSITLYLLEIKQRFIKIILFFVITFGICYFFSENIYQFLLKPLTKLQDEKLIYTHLFEAFFTYVKTTFISASLLSLPFLILQIYLFAAPGLYKKERKIFWFYIAISATLFLTSIILVYFYIIPLVWKFFLSFQSSSLTFIPKINEYLSVVFSLFLGFAVMFQLPVLLIFLNHINIIDVNSLQKWRKFVVVLIFIIAAFLTPPDIFSQVLLAIPLLILYELTILTLKIMKK